MIQNMLERLYPSPPYNMSGATLSLLQPLWGDIPAPPYPGLEGVRNKKIKFIILRGQSRLDELKLNLVFDVNSSQLPTKLELEIKNKAGRVVFR